MSEQENTNIVKQTYECFLRGDIESLLKLYADDVQWEVYGPASVPTTGVRNGLAEVAQFFAQVNDSLEAQSFEPQEFIAQGDQVAVLGHYTWTAKPTGRPFSANWAHVVTLSNGKITRFREYTDTAAAVVAFAGSGLAQQAGP
ncbi:MAG TPA: nuclear transport factor 2 family protein [Pyrinomonadaceae bacterium]|nr:nuclear transport factor 2 family protein [Pyrinomonadaceae bacterium]